MKALAIDLFCGLGDWTEGLLAEDYRVVGFDNERHVYGEARYPGKGSKSNARKAASAHIAKIPFVLSTHIARIYHPDK